MTSYDFWKLRSPSDQWARDNEDGCTCPQELGAGGVRKIDRDCPLHGVDPDIAYERMRDDD